MQERESKRERDRESETDTDRQTETDTVYVSFIGRVKGRYFRYCARVMLPVG